MKRISTQLALVLLVLTLIVPSFALAQSFPNPGRKPPKPPLSPAAIGIERDFDEALKMIQEQYVDGKKLNYSDVYKSSIIGMLRSLDPHSNYYDREEFDELKTDQRSEYFGIEIGRAHV